VRAGAQAPQPVEGQRVNHLEGAQRGLTTKLGLLRSLAASRRGPAGSPQQLTPPQHSLHTRGQRVALDTALHRSCTTY